MDEDIKTAWLGIAGMIYLFLGFFLGLLGIGILFSYPDPVWWAGLLLCISSGLLIYSSISSFLKFRWKEKANKKSVEEMRKASATVKNIALTRESRIGETGNRVLAVWTVPDTEWTKFRESEKKFRIRDSAFTGILIVLLSTLVIHYSKGESWIFSFLFSFLFASGFILLKYLLSRSITASGGKTGMEVIIGPDKLLINGKLFSISDEERWLEDLKITESAGQDILEFTYGWNTRKGDTTDTLLIPVPPGKRAEAENLVLIIRSKHGI